MGYCRRASSTTLLMVILAIVSLLLTLDRPVAQARHLKSPSTWAGEHSSAKDEGLQGKRELGAEHTKSSETVHSDLEKGSTGEGAATGASFGRGGNSPAASSSAEKVVVVARYGPRPHPKKHN